MLLLVRRFGQRLVLMIGGEALQSALHFALNIGLLHLLPARSYGVFALTMVMGGLGLTYIRALTAMPASIWIGSSANQRAANACDITFGSVAIVLAVVLGLIVSLVLRAWLGTDAIAGGLFVALWTLRGHLRIAIYARRTPLPVAVGDAAFTLTGSMLTLLLLVFDMGDKLQEAFALLAVANGLGIAATLVARRQPLRISLRRSVRRRYTALWRQLGWSGVGVTMTNLQGQGLALVVAAMAGPAAYAPIAAAFVLFTPLRIIAAAVANMLQPDLAAHIARDEFGRIWQQALTWTAILGAAGLFYGGAILAALPLFRSQVFVGQPMLLISALTWAIFAASMFYVLPRIILEASGAMRAIAFISAASSIVVIALAVAIETLYGPAWTLIAAIISEVMVIVGSWTYLVMRIPQSRPSSVATHFPAGVTSRTRGWRI